MNERQMELPFGEGDNFKAACFDERGVLTDKWLSKGPDGMFYTIDGDVYKTDERAEGNDVYVFVKGIPEGLRPYLDVVLEQHPEFNGNRYDEAAQELARINKGQQELKRADAA